VSGYGSDFLQYYRILEVEPGASLEEIKRAYREMARVWHPDRFPNDIRLQNKAQEKLKQINLAYEQICGRGTREPPRSSRPTASPPPPPPRNATRPAYESPRGQKTPSTAPRKPKFDFRRIAVFLISCARSFYWRRRKWLAVAAIAFGVILGVWLLTRQSAIWTEINNLRKKRTGSSHVATQTTVAEPAVVAPSPAPSLKLFAPPLALPSPQAAAAPSDKIPDGSTFGITEVSQTEMPDPKAETNLTLRIGVKKRPNTTIDHTKVKIQAFFYDTVGDKDTKLTDAQVSYEWLTPRHDWMETNPEILSVKYLRPKSKVPPGGPRKYLGYRVLVYYDDKLQAVEAEPARLLNLFPPSPTLPSSFSQDGLKTLTRGDYPLARNDSVISISAAKALATYAPLPEYPRKARSHRITGSGVCVLSVDPASGSVTEASMAQSTGSPLLDNSTVSTFRKWRFKPGTVSKVRIPVEFTMAGKDKR